MEMKRVSIFILISIIKICYAQNYNESLQAYGCDTYYCLTGTVKLVSLEWSDNDWISVNREGENFTVTLKRPLDWDNDDYVNYFHTTRENPEPELMAAVNSICVTYLSQGRLQDTHLLRSKLVRMLIPWDQDCPIPAGQYTTIVGFEGMFSLPRQPPSCDEFNAIMTFGEPVSYENFTVKMVVNVVPDNALECYREVTPTSEPGLVIETETDSQPGSELITTDGQLGPKETTETEYEPVSETITTESSADLQAYGCNSKRDRYCYTGTINVISLVSTDNEWISADGEGENITITLKKGLSWGMNISVSYFYTTPSDPEPQYFYLATTICGRFRSLKSEEDRHLLITQLFSMLFPDYERCPVPAGQYTPLRELQGGFSLFGEAPSCEEFNMILAFIPFMHERMSYEEADLILIAKVVPDNVLDCYRKPIPTSLPELETEPESGIGSQPGSTETESNSQSGSGETTKSQPGWEETTIDSQSGWGETTTESQLETGEMTTKSQPGWEETTIDSQSGWRETTTDVQSGSGEIGTHTTVFPALPIEGTNCLNIYRWLSNMTIYPSHYYRNWYKWGMRNKCFPDGWSYESVIAFLRTKNSRNNGTSIEGQPTDSEMPNFQLGTIISCPHIYGWFTNLTLYPAHYYKNWYDWGVRNKCFTLDWSYETLIKYLRSHNSENDEKGHEEQETTGVSTAPDNRLAKIINCLYVYGWFTDLTVYPSHYYKHWYDWGVRNYCFPLGWSYKAVLLYIGGNRSAGKDPPSEAMEVTNTETVDG